MPRYNFLDEAGLKQYHKLAGYSTIPITAITNYTFGELNINTGAVSSSSSRKVTDYITLPSDRKYTIVCPTNERSIICFYDKNNNFVSSSSFVTSVTFTLSDKSSGGVTPAKIRVSCVAQASLPAIQALHQNTISWLCNDILENRSDIAETQNLVMRLHSTCGISISPSTIEKGAQTTITIKDTYFRFDGKSVTPDHYIITDGDGSAFAGTLVPNGNIINTSNTVTDTGVRDDKTYTLSITHLGSTFTKSATAKAYYPMYFGSSGNESISKDNLNTIFSTATTIGTAKEVSGVGVFTKQPISGSPNGTRNFKVNSSQYIYLLVPSTMTINKVESSGFNVPMSSTGSNAPEVTGTNKGSYRVYRSEKKVNGGTLSIVIS